MYGIYSLYKHAIAYKWTAEELTATIKLIKSTDFKVDFAWRLLGMMPSISKAATVLQTDDWRSDRRTRLYHACIDILVQKINDLSGRDIHFRFGDQLYRRSRVFLDFLCMDGDEVSNATMCPTTQCTTCWCPKARLSDPDAVFPFRNTEEVREKIAEERRRLLHKDGTPRDRCKTEVCYIIYRYIPCFKMVYDIIMNVI